MSCAFYDLSIMNKVLLVTGGSRGIGAATARLAAANGYDVCISYRQNKTAADSVVRSIEQKGRSAIAIAADMASEADILRLFSEVDQQLGSLTALVNNAGILEQQTRVADMNLARLNRVFSTNVIGSFLCAREAVKRMSTLQGGAIVNISSGAATSGSPGEYIDYAASKGAIDTMTIGLAKEVAKEGIRVNAVRPGFIYTGIHASGGEPNRVDRVKAIIPLQRGGEPKEVAQAVLWLLSDKASFTTGSFINVTGGV